jgi:hypothetical protein
VRLGEALPGDGATSFVRGKTNLLSNGPRFPWLSYQALRAACPLPGLNCFHSYLLLWVVLAANLMAMVVQYLSAKLGIVTGRALPELVRDGLPRQATWVCAPQDHPVPR